jgi:hypothetical protein
MGSIVANKMTFHANYVILSAEGATTSYPKGEKLVVGINCSFVTENEILRFAQDDIMRMSF